LRQNQEDPKKDELFDDSFKPLSQAQAFKLFGDNLKPRINNPWEVVIFQCYLTILFTILVALINVKLKLDGVVISVLFGSILGVFPNIAFIMRMQISKNNYKESAEKFVYTLVSAEFIKITLLLIIMFLVVSNVPQLKWLPFLGMFIITLQANWLRGLKFKFLR
jgi:F0F1-type ATP synthase assembly protein I